MCCPKRAKKMRETAQAIAGFSAAMLKNQSFVSQEHADEIMGAAWPQEKSSFVAKINRS
jgi:hypothetical protein